MKLSCLVLAACGLACTGRESERPISYSLKLDRPLDQLAVEAARRLAAAPGELTLAGANGLEALAIRWQEDAWVDLARGKFAARLDDPAPLAAEEAAAFQVRGGEIDLDPRWQRRLVAEGHPARAPAPDPVAELHRLEAALHGGDPNALLAAWGRVHAWFGHVWLDGDRLAVGYDGIALERTTGGWQATDLLGVRRDYTVRRAGDHASMRQMRAGGSELLADRMTGESHLGH